MIKHINSNPSFHHLLLYVLRKLKVTFVRRCIRNAISYLGSEAVLTSVTSVLV